MPPPSLVSAARQQPHPRRPGQAERLNAPAGAQADRESVVRLLNVALAIEIVCVLRYRNLYLMATGIHAEPIAREFLEHVGQAQAHADLLSASIRQLGGEPAMDPQGPGSGGSARDANGRTGGFPRGVRARALPVSEPLGEFSSLMKLIEAQESRQVEQIVDLLRSAARGDSPPAMSNATTGDSPLTSREHEVLLLLSNGYAAINIAARLNLSHATVRNHIQNILRKMKVHGQVEAIGLAFRSGWM